MKLNNLVAVAAMVGASMAVTLQPGPGPAFAVEPDFFPKQKRGKGQNNRRGKGKRSPPKSRPNRLTISRRVRRKHRRSA
jgi:hypothetical protein